jgi:hypothetical protein
MYDEDDEFLRSIPPFLRRYQEPPPRKLPIRPRDRAATRISQEPRLPSRPAAPAAVTPAAAPPAAPPAAPTAAQVGAPATPRAHIALAFENHDRAAGADGDEVTFQVTLPRGVVRQIRALAAEKDTAPRAVVLRALRLAGLSVPEGSDLDHPDPAAPRRSQA